MAYRRPPRNAGVNSRGNSREIRAAPGEDGRRDVVGDHAAVCEHGQPLRVPGHHPHVVRHHQVGQAGVAAEVAEKAEQRPGVSLVLPGGRLIEDQRAGCSPADRPVRICEPGCGILAPAPPPSSPRRRQSRPGRALTGKCVPSGERGLAMGGIPVPAGHWSSFISQTLACGAASVTGHVVIDGVPATKINGKPVTVGTRTRRRSRSDAAPWPAPGGIYMLALPVQCPRKVR